MLRFTDLLGTGDVVRTRFPGTSSQEDSSRIIDGVWGWLSHPENDTIIATKETLIRNWFLFINLSVANLIVFGTIWRRQSDWSQSGDRHVRYC